MCVKRLLALGAASALVAAMTVSPASAHGKLHHSKTPSTCPVCTIENCTAAGRHTHDGYTYCGYNHESGSCDGSCRPVCTREDCTNLGRHTHSGLAYCGYDHESGYCDGSCLTIATEYTHHGHHGGHHC